jgi:hypothetical protein
MVGIQGFFAWLNGSRFLCVAAFEYVYTKPPGELLQLV